MISPMDYFFYHQKQLTCEAVDLKSIIKWCGTPTFVYSKAAMLDSVQELQKGLKGLDYLICYAVKANSALAVLNVLGEAGCGMDVVSQGELYRALKIGVPAKKIVFSGVGKSPEEMRYALHEGIYSFNVESLAELKMLESVATSERTIARVALRFNPDVSARTHPYISTGLKDNKFGLIRSEVMEAVKLSRHSTWLRTEGLSIHIGSQILQASPLDQAYRQTRQLLSEVESELGRELSFVDLGGGYGIQMLDEKPLSPQKITQLIQKHFKDRKNLKIIIEPGRSIVGNAGILVTQVLYTKPRKNKNFLIVDAGMNDFIRPALYDGKHQIIPLVQHSGAKQKSFEVVGPICESADFLGQKIRLPAQIQSADYLALLSAGAYGFSLSSQYNSRMRAAEVLVDDRLFRVIRRREKLAQLIRNEII